MSNTHLQEEINTWVYACYTFKYRPKHILWTQTDDCGYHYFALDQCKKRIEI